jgi:hypothetical protein
LVLSFEVETRDDESEDNNFEDISGNFGKFFPSATIFFTELANLVNVSGQEWQSIVCDNCLV